MNFFGRIFGAGRFNRAPARDFRPEDLPATRVRLFFDTLGVRWSAMVGVNLLYVACWLPAILWLCVSFFTVQQTLASAGDADMTATVFQLTFQTLLILWPLVAITGPATAGVTYVLRNWARGEHSFVFSDFREQAKKNWKQALSVSAITGALPLLTFLLWRFYGGMAKSVSALFLVPEALAFMAVFVWVLMLETIYTLMVTYNLTFRQLLKNAVLLALARLPLFVGVRLLTLALPALAVLSLAFIPARAAYVTMIIGFFYAVFGFALNRLLYASLANAVCEKYINASMGAPVNIGMRSQTPPPGEEGFDAY